MDPAMRIVRAVKKKYRDEHQGRQSQQRKTNSKVTMNSSRSTLTRFAMEDPFHHGDTWVRRIVRHRFCLRDNYFGSLLRVRGRRIGLQAQYQLLEHPSPVLVILELVEARTCRS